MTRREPVKDVGRSYQCFQKKKAGVLRSLCVSTKDFGSKQRLSQKESCGRNKLQNFKPRHEDVLLVTLPKSGSTQFKPLMFSIMNRTRYDSATHPLLATSPRDLVPLLELYLHQNIHFPNPFLRMVIRRIFWVTHTTRSTMGRVWDRFENFIKTHSQVLPCPALSCSDYI